MANNQIRYQIGFDIQQANLNQLKSSLQQIQKLKISDVMKINGTDASSAQSALIQIKTEAQNVEKALKEAFNTKLNTVNISTFNQSLTKSQTSIQQVYDTFKKAGTAGENAFRNLSTSVLSTNIQLKESHNLLDKMATTLANTIKWNAASAAINGITRSAQQAWGFVKNLDTSLNDIRIVTGKSAEEMENFAIKANEAAQSLGKSTTDYTNAALIYAQQGLSDREIEERAKITLKAANVTGQSTSDVSEQLTAVWNGYKVTAEEAELYVDRLAAVAATTASNLEELSTGMSKVASAAAAMGVGEQQLTAQLSTIISATRQAPQSVGTALRTVYARISDIQAGISEEDVTLGNYSGKMAELGFNVLDATGHLRDMGEVMQEIGGRWQTLTRQQQVNLAQTMAGQRQYNNLLALFDNFEKYNKALNTAQNAAGTLQKQQDTYMQSVAAHLEILGAAVEKIYNSLADTGAINGLIDGLTDIVNLVGSFVDSIGGGAGVLRALGSIGITVFSEQIAKGLNTTITNFAIGTENAKKFDQALQATREWQGIPNLDKTSKQLLNNRQQLLELARLMTPEQFAGMQTLLNNIINLGNEIKNIREKIQPLENTLKTFTDTSIVDAIGNEQEINKIEDEINNTADGLDKLQQNAKEVKEEFQKLFNSSKDLYQNTNIDTFSESFEVAKRKIVDLLNSFHDLKNTKAFQGLSAEAKEEFDKIDSQWDNLLKVLNNPKINIEVKNSALESFFNKLSQTVANSSDQVKKRYEELLGTLNDPELINTFGQKQQQLAKMMQDFEAGITRAQNTAKIENWAKVAGGITQVGSAIRQVQNLGSIWKNADLSTGEKLLQTITNLAMSLPMFISGFTKATQALGIMQIVETEEAQAALAATTAQTVHTTSINAAGVAATKATVKFNLLNKTISMTKGLIAGLGIMAAVTVAGIAINAINKSRQALIEENQKLIENENIKQEAINKNKELYASFEDLNQQYKDGELTRLQLKSAVEDLIDQYELEGAAAERLRSNYQNLTQAIQQNKRMNAAEGEASAQRQQKLARDEVLTQARGTVFDNAEQRGDKYVLGLKKGFTSLDESPVITNILKDTGAEVNDGNLIFTVDFNIDAISDLYDKLFEARAYIQETVNPSDYLNDQHYKNLNNWLNKMADSVERYRAATKDVLKYSSEIKAITAQQNNKVNFSNISSSSQYLTQRNQLVKQIQSMLNAKGDKTSNAGDMADVYLKENFKDIYNQYENIAKYIDTLKEKFKDRFNQKLINNLDQNTLNALVAIDPKNITSWEQLLEIIKKISETGFSNLNNLKDINSTKQIAVENYNTYQSVEESVQNGKNISAEQFAILNPEVQSFFDMMIDGSYQMTGNAKEFQNTINTIKFSGFYETLDIINQKIEQVQNKAAKLAEKDFVYDELDNSAYTQKIGGPSGTNLVGKFNEDLATQQLQYLSIVADSEQLYGKIADWQTKLTENHYLDKAICEEIAAEIAKAGDQTKGLNEETQQLKNEYNQIYSLVTQDPAFILDPDINESDFNNAIGLLKELSEEKKEFSEDLKDDEKELKRVSQAILRFDNAIDDVTKNYEDWMEVLSNENASVAEKAKIIDGLRDAYGDLLDIDGSSLSDEFLMDAENLSLMRDAINGSKEAYDELAARAAKEILVPLGFDKTKFYNDKTQIYNQILALTGQNFDDIKVGAFLNDQPFLNALENMINNTGMGVEQATEYLKDLGIDAEITSVPAKTENVHQNNKYWVPADYEVRDIGGMKAPRLKKGGHWINRPTTTTEEVSPATFSLKVTSAKKSSGGHIKFNHSSAPSSSGGSRSGGGGSSKGSEPDTSTKDTKDPLEDERDIYHDVNIEIQQINRSLERAQKQQDKLYGKELLDNLNKQTAILEQHKQKLKEKNELQKQDLANQKRILQDLGVTFDQYGNIANYMVILAKGQAQVNNLTQQYNALINQYNASTNKETKESINKQIEEIDKQIKKAEENLKNTEDKIKDYDSLRQAMEDLVDQIEQETQKQIELNIQKFRMQLEIRLDMGQAQRDWNDFKRNVLQHTDLIKDTNFSSIFKDALQNSADVTSYFNAGGAPGSVQKLVQQLERTRKELQTIDSLGKSAIYGNDKAKAMQDLQNDLDELMDQMKDIEDLIDNIDEAYLDTIDDIADQFDRQIDNYEFVGELIEHNIDLLQLLYGEKNYNAMDRYYTTLQQNQLKQLDSLKQQRDFWEQQWEKAIANGDTQAIKQFEQNYKNTIKNLNSLIQQSAQNLQDKYTNSVNKIFDELDKRISNNKGTDYVNMEWELMNKNAEEYLDTINSAYALQQLESKFQSAIDGTQNLKSQREIKKLMDEQLSSLKAKNKLTEYDVQRAEKLLKIEQARIALEAARSSKTSLRLKRDTQGNYSYEYAADEDMVSEAAQNLAAAQNELYNFDKDRYQSNLNDIIDAWKDFQSEYINIALDSSIDEEQRLEQLALLKQQYDEYMNNKTQENAVIRQNLMDSAFDSLSNLYIEDANNFKNMSDIEKAIMMQDLVPSWNSGVQQMADVFAGQGGFKGVCLQAFNDIDKATKDYKLELDDLAKVAGTDLNAIQSGVDILTSHFGDLITKNDELITAMQDEMSTIENVRKTVENLKNEYNNAYQAAKKAATATNEYILAQQKKAAEEAKKTSTVEAISAQNKAAEEAAKKTATPAPAVSTPAPAPAPTNNTANTSNTKTINQDTLNKVAAAIWVWGGKKSGWTDDYRMQRLTEKLGAENAKQVQSIINKNRDNLTDWYNWESLKSYFYSSFDTGGYTGNWLGDTGKLAILHKKEIVLNQDDTKNLLDTIGVVRSVMSSLGGTVYSRLNNIRNGFNNTTSDINDNIEQNVHIDANFPNVNSKREIQEAFSNLVNLAAQRAMKH